MLDDLPGRWRDRADLLERHGAGEAAATCRELAAELEAALEDAGDELLTLAEAAAESGYSGRRLRELATAGELENLGRRGAPRFRRADLPRKARTSSPSAYDPAEDAAALLAARGGA